MTVTTAPATRTGRFVPVAGWLCLIAGVLGAASGVYLAAMEPAVDAGQWSYPQSAGEFAATQVWFAVQHLGLLVGILALGASGAAGDARWARVAIRVAAAAMAALAITEVVAILPAEQDVDATLPLVLGGVYGLVSTVIGVALVAVGIAVVRARIWPGWRRWVPLATGVWVFVPMFPAMSLSFLGARLSISGWMLLFALLGWALVSTDETARS